MEGARKAGQDAGGQDYGHRGQDEEEGGETEADTIFYSIVSQQ